MGLPGARARLTVDSRFRLAGRRRLLLCVFLVLTGSTQAAELDRLPLLRPDAIILAFGDSLTDGVGGSGETYPQRLEQLVGHRVINAGVPGETTVQGRVRLQPVLEAQHADLLILCLGINDFLQGIPVETVHENLLAMLATAHRAGLPVLLLSVPARGSKTASPLFADSAATGGAALDDRSMVEVLSNPGLKADLIHPNREGYRQLADKLAERLRALGALPGRK